MNSFPLRILVVRKSFAVLKAAAHANVMNNDRRDRDTAFQIEGNSKKIAQTIPKKFSIYTVFRTFLVITQTFLDQFAKSWAHWKEDIKIFRMIRRK